MEEKTKKPVYTRWWFWLIVIFIIGAISIGNSSNNTTLPTGSYEKNAAVEVTIADFNTMTRDEAKIWLDNNKINGKITDDYSNTVSKGSLVSQSISANTVAHEGDNITLVYSLGKKPTTEEKNALKKAESYSQTMHMSKAKIYEQLTSEYGEGFTAEAAQYAIDNIQADWNANALSKAKSYQTTMSMSKSAIYKQLTSEYGEGFTAEEAQYAIDHLDD